jgi:hypothetical protein
VFVSIPDRIASMFELVPAVFEGPSGLEHERFRLRMLTVDDVVADFDALCSRVDHEGSPQPPFVRTVARNLVDLGWHQKEFELRRSFAYTVVAPDESQVLGCVYLYPRKPMTRMCASGCAGARSRQGSIRRSNEPSATGSLRAGRSPA